MMKQERLCSEMNRKALFFDIDGTLFSEIERQVPQSAVLALKKTRQCGNLVFINTGRPVCQTAGIQMEVESDGLLCGCGTYITTGNEVIYDRRIPAKRTARLKEDIVRFGLDGVLEGVEGCYFQRGESRMPMVNRLMELLKEGNAYVPLGWEDNSYDISKFCVAADRESRKMEFFATIEDEFEIIDRGGGFYECVPLGHSKATAVEAVLGRFGIAKEDAWVFGDSMNDRCSNILSTRF
jgi:HAD superfamily hydrolase (TIGR01484 family)